MPRTYINNYADLINEGSGISDSDTTFDVDDASPLGSPSASNYIALTIDDGTNVEVVHCTGVSSNTLTVVRGQDGTSGTAFSDNTPIACRPTRSSFNPGGHTSNMSDIANNNYAASAAPATTDDLDGGYEVGSIWVDTTAGRAYLAMDVSDDAAVWPQITPHGGGYPWSEETGTSATLVVDTGVIANNASLVTLTLPSTAAVGTAISVQGKGAGLFRVGQNASQVIHFGSSDTTTGTGGHITATNRYDSVQLLCITANTDWAVLSSVGSFTIT